MEECNFKHIVKRDSWFGWEMKGEKQCLLSNPRLPKSCDGEDNCFLFQMYRMMEENEQ